MPTKVRQGRVDDLAVAIAERLCSRDPALAIFYGVFNREIKTLAKRNLGHIELPGIGRTPDERRGRKVEVVEARSRKQTPKASAKTSAKPKPAPAPARSPAPAPAPAPYPSQALARNELPIIDAEWEDIA